MICIFLNGGQRLVKAHNLQALLNELQLGGKRLAVELNLEIVPRSMYENTHLREGDRVEIVQAIGGG